MSTGVDREVNPRRATLAGVLDGEIEEVILSRTKGTDLVGDGNDVSPVRVLRHLRAEYPPNHASVGLLWWAELRVEGRKLLGTASPVENVLCQHLEIGQVCAGSQPL